ncbi:hypothetical protein HanXRQr2_Chr01g0007311 [Helianthus annuus]|uniref:Uncharacterized protein n=1 Tax=Helianthus annuus TaxID=4232 RepID=A0A9K3JSG5_HELAN|nr:hypothetical protein HanXRQr2_Chr01g0007311 [Helianthus annuus]KAJ0610639.1 hypothetical protein HanHA300_Chr01g0005981 [Helianthus annuus]
MNLSLYDTQLTEFEGGEGFEFDFRVFKMHIARSRVTKSFFHLLSLHLIPSQGFHFGGNFATFSDSADFFSSVYIGC